MHLSAHPPQVGIYLIYLMLFLPGSCKLRNDPSKLCHTLLGKGAVPTALGVGCWWAVFLVKFGGLLQALQYVIEATESVGLERLLRLLAALAKSSS